jgi:hypothetical protein
MLSLVVFRSVGSLALEVTESTEDGTCDEFLRQH